MRRREVIRQRDTDHFRWTQSNNFENSWAARSSFAAAMCADSKAVCDIGCGMQTLRSLLHNGVTYLPADLVKRTEDTLVCDLNKKQLPDEYLRRADTVTMLGVIEYVYDVPWLFSALSSYSLRVILSYNPSDLRSAPRRRLFRFSRNCTGWVNDFTIGQLMRMIGASGFIVNDIRLVSAGQVLIKGYRQE